MAGNQVLEWTELDSEIKTAGLKNVCRVTSVRHHNSLTISLVGSVGSPRFVSSFISANFVRIVIVYLLGLFPRTCGKFYTSLHYSTN